MVIQIVICVKAGEAKKLPVVLSYVNKDKKGRTKGVEGSMSMFGLDHKMTESTFTVNVK